MSEIAHTYVLEGEPVSGKNHMQIRYNRKTKKPFVTKGNVATRWQLNAIDQLTRQRVKSRYRTMQGYICVEYTAYQRTDKCDVDNIEAALFDALKKAGAITDDKLIWDHRGKKALDKDNPRIEITISPIPGTP